MLVLLSLFFLGGSVIHDFSLILLVGIIIGTYSSIFVASPILTLMPERKI
jgi:preprotein translocase subunit SecF